MKKKTVRKNAAKPAAIRKGASAEVSKPKATKSKVKKANIRSTDGYKAGFEAGLKKGQALQAKPDKQQVANA